MREADMPTRVAVALGSNLGDCASHLQFALARLPTVLTHIVRSRWSETLPVGVGSQPPFLNGAVTGETTFTARGLLDALLAIEAERGRVRAVPGAPRTLDLDLVLFGSEVIDEPRLVVPHPRFRARRFVLEPLADIAPDLVDPVTGLTIAELLARL